MRQISDQSDKHGLPPRSCACPHMVLWILTKVIIEELVKYVNIVIFDIIVSYFFHRKAPGLLHRPGALGYYQRMVMLPEVMRRPLLRSNSRMLSSAIWTLTLVPMENRRLPKTTPVRRKSPTRIFTVDSMPVGIAP